MNVVNSINHGARTALLHGFACMTLVAAALHAPHAFAAEAAYPTKPVRLIVPYAPGGGVDGVGRLMAQDLAPRLGQQIVIDNRGGGGGIVGLDIAAHSVPDGYTLLVEQRRRRLGAGAAADGEGRKDQGARSDLGAALGAGAGRSDDCRGRRARV